MELIDFLANLAIFHQDKLKKRMNRITATWRSGCFGKRDDHPVHTINGFTNHHCCKMVTAALKYVPQPAATTFAFSSVLIPLSAMGETHNSYEMDVGLQNFFRFSERKIILDYVPEVISGSSSDSPNVVSR